MLLNFKEGNYLGKLAMLGQPGMDGDKNFTVNWPRPKF
jgi:hypothetical protein